MQDQQTYWSKPMMIGDQGAKSYDFMDCANNMGVQRLQHDTGELKGTIKDAEANIRFAVKDSEADIRREVAKAECDIRHDVLTEGQEILRDVNKAECNLSKEILETKHTLAKDILRSEYENKLAIQTAIKEVNDKAQYNTDRTQDKIAHSLEEIREDLCSFRREEAECCCELKNLIGGVGAATSQTGLVNAIVSALNVK